MNVWDRKALRQIESATEQVDIETACHMLSMVLKQKVELLPNSKQYAIIYSDNRLYRMPQKLANLLIRSKL